MAAASSRNCRGGWFGGYLDNEHGSKEYLRNNGKYQRGGSIIESAALTPQRHVV
jgi:hypothetical protein